jgi:hypothetical protein
MSMELKLYRPAARALLKGEEVFPAEDPYLNDAPRHPKKFTLCMK